MKTKSIFIFLTVLLFCAFTNSCSKDDPDIEETYVSLLSGEYSKDGPWKLEVSINGVPLEDYGSVLLETEYIKDSTVTFINVIPGIAEKTFEHVKQNLTEKGQHFDIEFTESGKKISISGSVSAGLMIVDISM